MKLAELTMNRYQALLKLDAIAKQDVDNAAGAYEADKATVESQGANVKRLEQMVGFEKVVAPFDGVITARNTDVGQLINAGKWRRGAGAVPAISSSTKLRIFVSVPQTYSNAADSRHVARKLTWRNRRGGIICRKGRTQIADHHRSSYANVADGSRYRKCVGIADAGGVCRSSSLKLPAATFAPLSCR